MDNRLREPLRSRLDAVGNGWRDRLQAFAGSDAGRALAERVDARVAAGASVYPDDPFRALALTPPEAVRAVILGQDPYHGPGQAEGLAFSVADGQRWPPSLRNVLAEWQRDLGHPRPVSGSLRRWAGQGVLLLNTALTVEDGRPGSHADWGWRALTSSIVADLLTSREPVAFLLWGAHAQAVADRAAPGAAHLRLACNHPSPLSARRGPVPFVGCGHFGQADRWLRAAGRGGLDWALA